MSDKIDEVEVGGVGRLAVFSFLSGMGGGGIFLVTFSRRSLLQSRIPSYRPHIRS